MSNFKKFKKAVDKQFKKMCETGLWRTAVDKDVLWDTYLSSFDPIHNPIFRERTEHDCQCCKQFIRAAGNAVTIIGGELVSIWDIEVGGHYQAVADALSALAKANPIQDVFLHPEKHLGTDHNIQAIMNADMTVESTITWDHFHYELPAEFVERDGARILGNKRDNKEVLKRALEEISSDAVDTVLELIEQGSLYRGEEHKATVEKLQGLKAAYDACLTSKDVYCWVVEKNLGGHARIRNTVIGTLLTDISDGMDLDKAVTSFESKVAPTNYKRPTALISKKMIDAARKKVKALGIEDSLSRRFAVAEDITINNVLFADRSIKKHMKNVFDEMADEAPEKKGRLKKVDVVSIDTFIKDVLPNADSLEVLVENKHNNNMMSLIAPMHADAKPIFKWNNNFSWAYQGEVTDSIKERVKQAGGNVEGILRCSLSWYNTDDLDIHVIEPNGHHIGFNNKRSDTSGTLDVDMNVRSLNCSRNAVENIVWTKEAKMLEGVYRVYIYNYRQRETVDVGFEVEIEHAGTVHSFHYAKKVGSVNTTVAEFTYSHENGIRFIHSLPLIKASKEVWGIHTEKFQKVSMVMRSPNHWDGRAVGNAHLFFILDNCKNDKETRGFFNEFLKESLHPHRKVFEVLGSKMKAPVSEDQLSGVGFSSTQRNHIFCKVGGSFERTIKINF